MEAMATCVFIKQFLPRWRWGELLILPVVSTEDSGGIVGKKSAARDRAALVFGLRLLSSICEFFEDEDERRGGFFCEEAGRLGQRASVSGL
jgi:hypothetical protein